MPKWEPIVTKSRRPELADITTPGMRGGHQMCIDSAAQLIYMYGGWDGNHDLADFWVYDIADQRWSLISRNTEEQVRAS